MDLQPIPSRVLRAGHGPAIAMPDSPQRQSLREALVMLEAAEVGGRPHDLCAALTAVGRSYRRLAARRAAEDALRQALRWAHAIGAVDQEVDLLSELAECACDLADSLDDAEFRGAHAARDRARDAAFEASRLAHRASDPVFERQALLRLSDVLNRCGDHDDAAWLQQRALALACGGA